jgi:DNA polymerase III subunit delta'
VRQVFGHEEVRRELATAAHRGRLPGSLLIHGLPGSGRQTVALWLARLLICESPTADGPCDRCVGCRLALELQHPDVHWFFPLPRPKGASGPDKLAEALEAARFDALAARRADPLHQPADEGPGGLYLAQVRTIRRFGAKRPSMAAHQVFIVGNAELLVPQEASEEAANAMLKILEEPPPATTFILTAAEPDALLPTLRSRLLPIRLRPFPDEDVAAFLRKRAGAGEEDARILARLGQGSIGRAMAHLSRDDGRSRADQTRSRSLAWLIAALDPEPGPRYAAALDQRPVAARGAFGDTLDALALHLRDLAAVQAGADDDVVDLRAAADLRAVADRVRARGIPRAIALVEEARDDGRINANPQLTLAWLLDRISVELRA